jgi:hypothetical protein
MGRIRSAFGTWSKGTGVFVNLLPPFEVQECLKVKRRRSCKPHEQQKVRDRESEITGAVDIVRVSGFGSLL